MLKGSLATDLYKGRGCKLDMTSYRGIVCSSVLSKHHQKFLRSRLLYVVGPFPSGYAVRWNPQQGCGHG